MSNNLLDTEVKDLEQRLITMASLAEQSVNRAAKALLERDESLANQVEADDAKLDEMEVAVDQAVFTFLYRQRPVAHDLRLALAAAKISTDLERIGDVCVTLCRCAKKMMCEAEFSPKTDIGKMARIGSSMLTDVISSFSRCDVDKLEQIIARDKELDALHHQLVDEAIAMMEQTRISPQIGSHLVIAARNLERVGDHAKNIAKELIFVAKAVDIRHTQEGANQPTQ